MKIQVKTMLILFIALAFITCKADDIDDIVLAVYAIGDTGPSGVGIVFYITDGGLHGLEAAPSDQSTSQAWIVGGTTQTTLNGNTSTDIGTGSANTGFIIAQPDHTGSAAQICREDYTGGGETDWFLPSKDELNQLYLQKETVGGFFIDAYWSSSEASATTAWSQLFGGGAQSDLSLKNYTYWVRAVRAF